MKHLRIIIAFVAAIALSACHDLPDMHNDMEGNFDAIWQTVDQRYCFFREKGVDWDEIGRRYRAQIDPEWTRQQFFDHCAAMLAELRDGHTNLISWFDISYYRAWWTDYPQNFDRRIIEQYYLGFDYRSGANTIYKYLEDRRVGYVHYSSFEYAPSHSFIDIMLLSMKDADALIFDVRDNGGGDITNVEHWVGHFLKEPTIGGYICHKTGPAHDAFSEPYAYTYEPQMQHVRWLKPVIILTNRSTFSAANQFVAAMRGLPQVTIVGDTTGGGSGMPFSYETPCGWGLRFSACPVYDAEMRLTEMGVDPDHHVDIDPLDALAGHDTILDAALALAM